MSNSIIQVPIDELMADPGQPRRVWVQSELDKLKNSIAARGVLHPLRVMWDDERKLWRIVTGESRWRAAKLAGLASVPCWPIEGEPSETEILSDQIIENSCRHDLRPLDLARAMVKLKRLKGCTSQDLAAELGIGGASVTRAEALLTLPEDVQAMVDDGRLAESSAYEISRLKDEDAMRKLALLVVETYMTRDKIIASVQKTIPPKTTSSKPGRLSGKLDGVSFSFSFAAGQLTPDTLLKAIEHIRTKLKELQKSEQQDVSALGELLKAS